MNPTSLKSAFVVTLMCLVFAGDAQNTSIGIPTGTYKKSDTTTSYNEDPEKHAHTQTIVIDKDKDKSRSWGEEKAIGKGNAEPGNDAQANEMSTKAPHTPGEAGYDGATTTESSTITQTEDNCSCSALHIAYGFAGAGILGLLIFLLLYINEKNKNSRNGSR